MFSRIPQILRFLKSLVNQVQMNNWFLVWVLKCDLEWIRRFFSEFRFCRFHWTCILDSDFIKLELWVNPPLIFWRYEQMSKNSLWVTVNPHVCFPPSVTYFSPLNRYFRATKTLENFILLFLFFENTIVPGSANLKESFFPSHFFAATTTFPKQGRKEKREAESLSQKNKIKSKSVLFFSVLKTSLWPKN